VKGVLDAQLNNLTAFGGIVNEAVLSVTAAPSAIQLWVPPDSAEALEAAKTAPPPSDTPAPAAPSKPSSDSDNLGLILGIGLPVLLVLLVVAMWAVRSRSELDQRNRELLMDNGRAENWEEKLDDSGSTYYINRLTGQVLYETPMVVVRQREATLAGRPASSSFVASAARRLSQALSPYDRATIDPGSRGRPEQAQTDNSLSTDGARVRGIPSADRYVPAGQDERRALDRLQPKSMDAFERL